MAHGITSYYIDLLPSRIPDGLVQGQHDLGCRPAVIPKTPSRRCNILLHLETPLAQYIERSKIMLHHLITPFPVKTDIPPYPAQVPFDRRVHPRIFRALPPRDPPQPQEARAHLSPHTNP